MRVVILPVIWTVVIDFAAWFFIHLGTAILAQAMPDRFFADDRGIYRTRAWEQDGRIWQTLFRVRRWKHKLPDGALITGRGFAKRSLRSARPDELERYVLESRRAEWAHLLAILPAILFFLWNPPAAGWLMVAYAAAANTPCLIAQRYNRPRVQRILERQRKPTVTNIE